MAVKLFLFYVAVGLFLASVTVFATLGTLAGFHIGPDVWWWKVSVASMAGTGCAALSVGIML